jgi:hypothetical protein
MKRIRANLASILWFGAGVVVAGCAPLTPGDFQDAPPKPMIHAFDAVKRIEPAVTAEADPSEFRQTAYGLSPTARLLMRFMDFPSHIQNVRIDGGSKVQVQITALSDVNEAAAAIQVCPLTRHFMMFATWQAAHQFGSSGRWQTPGGDFDPSDCAKGTISDAGKGEIVFDVTQWFIDYPKARGVNYGLIAMSTKAVQIAGDTSGSEYPRLLWSE